ncbi:MAG: relaxase/mobilization nuclease domain-containing protein [Lachnospiraceae bacterium]|nr:relaxase/mobilization nuclease domain-containing protein [Lachnospiraceae bacterium]
MAVLKHNASKNADYGQIMDYLLFQHNEITNKPILDEQGRMVLREEYYMDGINCEPMLLDEECEMVNHKFHKNNKYDEIKSHHYIISFDPKDTEDHGLTGEKAQALGMEYARKNFPGHQALVCTHTDGHNNSGNIHVHIVINSVRKLDVPEQPFMERRCDSRAGFKHHLTKDYLRYLQKEVMEMCQRENLYQVDLLSPSTEKVSEREYWAKRKGQQKLDELNEQIVADGLTPRNTIFQTKKQSLRDSISDIASTAKSMEEFQTALMEKYEIEVIEKRGRLSYHIPDRDKNISERALGTHYGKEYLLKLFAENQKGIVHDASDKEPVTPATSTTQAYDSGTATYNPSYDYEADPIAILFIRSDLRLVVDLQNCVKAQQNEYYAEKVKVSNLQQMAKTIAYVQEHEYGSRENLQLSFEEVSDKLSVSRRELKDTEGQLKDINQQIHYTGQYLANKSIYGQMLNAKSKGKFRNEHSSEIQLYEAAVKYLKDKNPYGNYPSMKSLKEQKEKLTVRRSAQNDTYSYFRDYQKELRTVCSNVDSILGTSHTRNHRQEKSQDL